MSKLFGWSLPPGVTDRMIDEAAEGDEEERPSPDPDPEDEDTDYDPELEDDEDDDEDYLLGKCDDCSEVGERTGHQTCQYPQNHA